MEHRRGKGAVARGEVGHQTLSTKFLVTCYECLNYWIGGGVITIGSLETVFVGAVAVEASLWVFRGLLLELMVGSSGEFVGEGFN